MGGWLEVVRVEHDQGKIHLMPSRAGKHFMYAGARGFMFSLLSSGVISLPGKYIHDLIMPSTPYKRIYYTMSTNNISIETWIQEFQPLFMSEQVSFAARWLTSYLWFNKKKKKSFRNKISAHVGSPCMVFMFSQV